MSRFDPFLLKDSPPNKTVSQHGHKQEQMEQRGEKVISSNTVDLGCFPLFCCPSHCPFQLLHSVFSLLGFKLSICLVFFLIHHIFCVSVRPDPNKNIEKWSEILDEIKISKSFFPTILLENRWPSGSSPGITLLFKRCYQSENQPAQNMQNNYSMCKIKCVIHLKLITCI